MRVFEYDFTNLQKSLSSLISGENSGYKVMKGLDDFFQDIKCLGVKYTENVDNTFFGICVKTMHMKPEEIMDFDNEDVSPNDYMVEIDSKLATLLTPAELSAVLINDIKNIVSHTALEGFRNAISYYIGMNKMTINIANINHYENIFYFMYDQSVATLYSIFKASDDSNTMCADDFMIKCGLAEQFYSAVDKIKSSKESIYTNELSNNLLVMQWYLSIVDEIHINTRYVSTILRELFYATGSKLTRLSILNSITELEPMTDTHQRYYTSLTESAKKKSLFGQIKDSGLRAIEQDVYEYMMRIKNVEDEDDALLLMRQINNRIAILEDYIYNEELNDAQYGKWNSVLQKYIELRESLTKKTVYKQKMYGLFADYNALQQMYARGQLQTIY